MNSFTPYIDNPNDRSNDREESIDTLPNGKHVLAKNSTRRELFGEI